MSFTAKFPGFCHRCLERIEKDDQVDYDESDELVHADCDLVGESVHLSKYSVPVLQRGEVVCTICFIVKPCECDS